MNGMDIIIVDGGEVFEGTREQFQDAFFSNASDEEIENWCHDNGFSLDINRKVIIDKDREDYVLDKPLSTAELRKIADKNDWLEVTVKMKLADIVNSTNEEFIERISELITGTSLMTDISYSLAGCYYDFVLIRACGTVTEIVD